MISIHAEDRLWQRLGWRKETADRMIQKVINDGVSWRKTKGTLRRFLEKKMIEHRRGNETRIFGRHIYVLQDETLITVLDLPKKFHHAIDKLSV